MAKATTKADPAARQQAEPELELPDPKDIEEVAVRLCIAAGHKRPYSFIAGNERWKGWAEEATRLIIAFNYLSGRKSK